MGAPRERPAPTWGPPSRLPIGRPGPAARRMCQSAGERRHGAGGGAALNPCGAGRAAAGAAGTGGTGGHRGAPGGTGASASAPGGGGSPRAAPRRPGATARPWDPPGPRRARPRAGPQGRPRERPRRSPAAAGTGRAALPGLPPQALPRPPPVPARRSGLYLLNAPPARAAPPRPRHLS